MWRMGCVRCVHTNVLLCALRLLKYVLGRKSECEPSRGCWKKRGWHFREDGAFVAETRLHGALAWIWGPGAQRLLIWGHQVREPLVQPGSALCWCERGHARWAALWGRLEKAPGGQQATSQLHVFSKIPPAVTADLTGGIWKRRRGEV